MGGHETREQPARREPVASNEPDFHKNRRGLLIKKNARKTNSTSSSKHILRRSLHESNFSQFVHASADLRKMHQQQQKQKKTES